MATLPASELTRLVIDYLELPDNPRQKPRREDLQGSEALARTVSVSYGTVTKWLKGETSPGYEQTVRMLDICGWLNITVDLPPPDSSRLLQEAADRIIAAQALVDSDAREETLPPDSGTAS